MRTTLIFSVALVVILGTLAPTFAQKAQTEPKSQTTCPVMGGSINKSLYVDYEGKRIYMCCSGCSTSLKNDPAKYIKQLEDEGVTLDKTPVKEAEKEEQHKSPRQSKKSK